MFNLKLYTSTAVTDFWLKENKFKLSNTLKGKSYLFISISSESVKIVQFMGVKEQVLCT